LAAGALVVQDQQLEMGVAGQLEDGIHTGLQQMQLVAGGYQQAKEWQYPHQRIIQNIYRLKLIMNRQKK
jgi:hypothetical protein